MSTSASSGARARWSAFLGQIADRHRAIGAEVAESIGRDEAERRSAWAVAASRMIDLEARIIDTWNAQVGAAYEADQVDMDTHWADRARGADLAFELELERRRLEHRVFPDNPHARAWTAAQREWETMVRADRAYRQTRSPAPLAVIQGYERAQIDYYRAYATAESRENPAIRDVAHEVRSRMQGWYERNAEFEEAWRKAGRPRLPI